MSTPVNEHAEALKVEGNTLFQAGEYRLAYRKYTEAIREDPKNAIYYSNRAACNINLKE
jgi:tetratricopeptide (TPR) repeat protein